MRTKNLKANKKKTESFRTLTNAIVSRANIAQRLGQSYGTDRQLYTMLGYPDSITFERYNGRYTRQDIAKRVVDAYPEATWRSSPEVFEDRDAEKATAFEESWKVLLEEVDVFHYMTRVDKMAGIGRYGVILMGFDDGKKLDKAVRTKRGRKLLYLQPYDENHATIKKKVMDPKNSRYGLPETYQITPDTEQSSNRVASIGTKTDILKQAGSFEVHWTRIIHVAEGTLGSDVYGTPRLECIYNRLQDLEMLAGGSAEMFWRGAFPGYNFKVDTEAAAPSESDMEDEIESYIHGLARYMKLQNIDVQSLDTQVASPKDHINAIVSIIAGAKGIPQRILLGSERGELASSQDERAWNERVEARRTNYADPIILKAFIDRLIEFGVLVEPKEGYQIEWPPMATMDEKAKADVAKTKSEALSKYAGTPGIDEVMPPQFFLTEVMEMEQEKVDAIMEAAAEAMEESLEQERKDAEEFERQRQEIEKEKLKQEKVIKKEAV